MPAALSAVIAALLALQGGGAGGAGGGGGGGAAPLRKSDLVRLLSGSVMSSVELVELVSRNCLTFQPTDRDRNDLRMLGADASLLAVVDECTRRKAPRRPVPVTPVRTTLRPPAPPAR